MIQFLIQILSCLYSIIKLVFADLIQVPLLPPPLPPTPTPLKIWSRSITWCYPCVLLSNNDHVFLFFKIKRDGWRRGATGMERGVTYHLQNRTRLPKLLSVSPSPQDRSILKTFQQDCEVYVASYCTCSSSNKTLALPDRKYAPMTHELMT